MANVLLADDDPDTVEVSTELLQSRGHRIHTGYNGKEGLKSLREQGLPDCIVLDVDMPVMNGPGMAHEMLMHDAGEERIPIVLVSARADLSEVARRIGTPYFLAKASTAYGDNLTGLLDRALRERVAPAPPTASSAVSPASLLVGTDEDSRRLPAGHSATAGTKLHGHPLG